MDVSRIRALRGPNLWSRHTAIQAIVTCAGAERAIADLAGFEDRLRDRARVSSSWAQAVTRSSSLMSALLPML